MDDPGGGLGVGDEDDPGVRRGGADPCRVERLAPRLLDMGDVGAVGGGQLQPALAEVAGRRDHRPVAGRQQVDHRRLHRVGAGAGDHQHLAGRFEHRPQPGQRLGEQALEIGAAVMQDGLRQSRLHLRWHRRRPGRDQVRLLWQRRSLGGGRFLPAGSVSTPTRRSPGRRYRTARRSPAGTWMTSTSGSRCSPGPPAGAWGARLADTRCTIVHAAREAITPATMSVA